MLRFFFGSLGSRIALALAILSPLPISANSEEDPQAYYQRGMQLLAEHNNAQAAVELQNAVKLKKDFVAAWLGLAQIEELNRNWAGVIPILRAVVELDPKDVSSRLKLARLLLFLAGSVDEARDLVNAANEIDNRNADILALNALILFKLNDTPRAMLQAQAALALDPQNTGAMAVLAANRLARGDAQGALQILDKAAAQKKDLGIELFRLTLFEKSQDLEKAEAVLRELVATYPAEPEFRRQLVRLYVYQRRGDDAEKEQRAIVAALPNDSDAELELVRVLNSFKGPTDARQELVSRIQSGSEVFPYQIALAALDSTHDHFKDAVELLETLIHTGSPEQVLIAQAKLAEIYLSHQDIDAAETIVADILRKESRNISALKLRASIRTDRGQFDAAIADLRQALNDQPQSAELMLLLAMAYDRKGLIELADKQFMNATKTSGFDKGIGLSYVAFLQRHGNTEQAEDIMTKLVDRWPDNVALLSVLGQLKLTRRNWAGAQQIAEAIRRIGNDRGAGDRILGAALNGKNAEKPAIQSPSAIH